VNRSRPAALVIGFLCYGALEIVGVIIIIIIRLILSGNVTDDDYAAIVSQRYNSVFVGRLWEIGLLLYG